MEKNSIVDHLVYNNPYERFMIMILERLEKLEDRMEKLDNKMSIVIGNISNNIKNVHVIFKIVLDKRIDIDKIDTIYNFLHKELSCTQCFFSLHTHTSSIQLVCTDTNVFQKFSDMLDKFKHDNKITINSISIEPDVSFPDGSFNNTNSSCEIYMLYKSIDSSQVKKIKLHTILP